MLLFFHIGFSFHFVLVSYVAVEHVEEVVVVDYGLEGLFRDLGEVLQGADFDR